MRRSLVQYEGTLLEEKYIEQPKLSRGHLYVEAFWNLVNWDFVATNLAAAVDAVEVAAIAS